MLKMGFKEDIDKIILKMKIRNKNHVQKCMFSATFPDWVQEIIREHMLKSRIRVDLAQDL